MKVVEALKLFFERADEISPGGGRKLTIVELKELSADERRGLATLAARELGEELEPA